MFIHVTGLGVVGLAGVYSVATVFEFNSRRLSEPVHQLIALREALGFLVLLLLHGLDRLVPSTVSTAVQLPTHS